MNQPQTGKGAEQAVASPLVAWEVEINYMPCVVFAATKAKAKWTAVKSYWEAYGKNGSWPHCSIARRPAHDSYPGEPGRAYSTSYIRG
jgi:hypothetical protein